MSPSRLVFVLDELVEAGLVERQRSKTARRHSELVLTLAGRQMLLDLTKLAAEHETELCAGLNAEERGALVALCRKVAAQQGLTPDVHPGYRHLSAGTRQRGS